MKKSKRDLMLLAVAVVALGVSSSVNAGVVAECTSTAYNAMSTSFGSGTDYTMVGSYTGFTSSYSLMQFDVSGLTDTVDQVYLQVDKYTKTSGMFDNTSDSNPITVSVSVYSGDLESDSIDLDAISDVTYDIQVIGADGYYYFDVTEIVNAWIESGVDYGCLVLSVEVCSSGNSFTYLGGINSSVADAPVLTTVPEPATMALLGLGAFMLRRKKRA